MKKLLFALLFLASPAFAQTQTQYYTVPSISALKAMTTSRPTVVQVVDANPGIFNLSAGACSAADDIFQVQPTAGTTVCYTRAATPYAVGTSVAISVSNIAALTALTTRPAAVTVQGYTTAGDGGGGQFYWVAGSSTAVNVCNVVNPPSGTAGRYFRLEYGIINLRGCGAVGDNSADDTSAVNAWFARVMATGSSGYAPAGTYKTTSAVVFDYVLRQYTGFTLYGDGEQSSQFVSTMTTGGTYPFSVVTSGGSIITPAIGAYVTMRGMAFRADIASPVLRLGYTDYSDQQNRMKLSIWVYNQSDHANAVAVQLNAVYNPNFAINGGVGATAAAAGKVLQLRQVAFGNFDVSVGGTVGSTVTAIHITNSFNYGNVFSAPDCEVVGYCVDIDSAGATANTFIGGQWAYGTYAVRATAGSNNRFIGPNINAATPFFVGGANNVGVFRSELEHNYQLASPTTGQTVTMAETTGILKLVPAGTLATLIITLPPNPGDGQRAVIQSTYNITALTLNVGRVGDTISGTIATLGATKSVELFYWAAAAQWTLIEAQQSLATNSVMGNATASTATPTALAISSCSTTASALTWTTNTGFGCNTSVTAAAVPVGGITGLGTGVATFLATPSSANLAAAVTDKTGSGALVFATSPTFTGTITTGGYTVAALPAAPGTGARAYVTNQLTTCAGVGVALTGGGAVTCPVFYNGTAWVGG